MSTTMTIRLEAELKQRLDQLAEATHRSKSFLAAEALRDFIELNECFVAFQYDVNNTGLHVLPIPRFVCYTPGPDCSRSRFVSTYAAGRSCASRGSC